MLRDWDAEWAEIEAEYRAAHEAVVATHEPVKPAPVSKGKTASTEDFAAFGKAHEQFESVKARRSAFLAERRISDPKWSALDASKNTNNNGP